MQRHQAREDGVEILPTDAIQKMLDFISANYPEVILCLTQDYINQTPTRVRWLNDKSQEIYRHYYSGMKGESLEGGPGIELNALIHKGNLILRYREYCGEDARYRVMGTDPEQVGLTEEDFAD
jgi:hypothetical protein